EFVAQPADVLEGIVHIAASLVFFFSSRGRHTRSDRAWSSDVCSSALSSSTPPRWSASGPPRWGRGARSLSHLLGPGTPIGPITRSEERRVGKECRSRWSTDHKRKNR